MTLSAGDNSGDPGVRASSTLRELGFGAHESAVVLALNRLGAAPVSDLSSETGIHHANLYAVLEALEARGFVLSDEGRPRVYQFAPLTHLEEMLTAKVKQLVIDLKKLQETRDARSEVPTLIYTIRGEAEVAAKMQGMLARAQGSITLVAPDIKMLGSAALDALSAASARGVKIQAILGEVADISDVKLDQRVKEDTAAIDIVVDSTEALISMPDLSVCGWADNPLISIQLEGFLQQTWQIAKKV